MPYTHTLIKASAGSGKTFQLSNRYLQLVFDGVSPDTILATTFTRKAAGEILGRIFTRLADAVSDETQREELAKYVLDVPRERILATLADLVKRIHTLRVSTLDSFFQQIAGSFNLELEIPPGWMILEAEERGPLITEAVRMLLERSEKNRIIELMNLLFKGETNATIAGEIEKHAIALTSLFSESLPDAWKTVARARELSSDELKYWIQCLGVAEIMTNKDGSLDKNTLKARDKDLTNLNIEDTNQIDWESIGSIGMCQKVLDKSYTYSRKEMTPSLIAVYEKLVSHIRAVVINKVVLRTEALGELMKDVSTILNEQKQKSRLFEFSDITERLAASNLNTWASQISHRTNSQTHHLLLDEFQDTSPNQWKVLRPFAEQIVSESDQTSSFFCVGDVKQAIYGWRGGIAAIFDTIENDLGKLNEKHLDTSFRSAPPVIETVNHLFKDISTNDALRDFPAAAENWQHRFEKHSTEKEHYAGWCSLETSKLPISLDGQEIPREQKSFLEKKAHIDYVIEQVVYCHERAPGATIGILTRTNKMIRKIIDLLREKGIEASEEGGNPLDQSPAVELILSALTLADHPGNRIVRFHLANSPLGILLNILPFNYRDDKNAQTVSWKIRKRLIYEGYFPVLREWSEAIAPVCFSRDLRKLTQLLELASLYQPKTKIRTRPFVNMIRARKVEDPNAAKIRVMSIHKSKGLQFDIVILPELDEFLAGRGETVITHRENITGPIDTVFANVSEKLLSYFPERIRQVAMESKNARVEESLCLLYVAMTRAIHELVMIIKPKENEKEPTFSKTMAGVLRAALAPDKLAEEETTLYSYPGNHLHWINFPSTPPHIKMATLEIEHDKFEEVTAVDILLKPKKGQRNFNRVTPSELEGEDDNVDKIVPLGTQNIFARANNKAINRGLAIHACFEKIIWLDQPSLDFEAILQIMRPFIADESERKHVANEFMQMCESAEIRDNLLKTSSQTRVPLATTIKVFNERKFMIRIDSGTLQLGSIDRLVVYYQNDKPIQAEIIDFKTDQIPSDPDKLSQRADDYRPQLEAYRKAVAKLYKLEPSQISISLFFTSLGKIVNFT